MKKRLSLILAMLIILTSVPMGEIVAWAADGPAAIKEITVIRTYDEFDSEGEYLLTIEGSNLGDDKIRVMDSSFNLIEPKSVEASTNFVVQYRFDGSQAISRIYLDGVGNITIDESNIPKITGRQEILEDKYIDSTDRFIDAEEDMYLIGDNLENLKNPELKIKARFGKEEIEDKDIFLKEENGNEYKIKKNVGKTLGTRSFSLIKEYDQDANNGKVIPIEIQHVYRPVVIVRGEINISDKVTMFPTQGPGDSLVSLMANKIESNVSIFFMKKGEEYKYTKANMVKNESINHNKIGKEERLRFRVPMKPKEEWEKPNVAESIDNGLYEIVLTNRVNPENPIESQINKYKFLENNHKRLEFLVVDGGNVVELDSINPKTSSNKGIDAKIKGQRIGRLSPNIYENGIIKKINGKEIKRSDDEKINNIKDDNIKETRELVIEYSKGEYNGKEIDTLTRKISVQIGSRAYITGYDFTGDIYDFLDIRVPENDDPKKPIKDVILSIEDEIKFKDEAKVSQSEGGVLLDGFTYKQMDYQPEINTIIPNIIQVDENGLITEDVILSIRGESFLKYGYIENEKLKIKIPEISIENQSRSSKWFDKTSMRIFDDKKEELEDKTGEQFGNIIKIKINKDEKVPDALINTTSNLKLQNPLAIESDGDMGSSAFGEIRFVQVGTSKTPNIREVRPNIITVEGENGVIIEGSNFDRQVKIYLDGEEIRGVKRNGTGTELEFNAPPKSEGQYQILVQNEEGGLAIYNDFLYTKTYTDIKLNDFNPKKGSANTLVTIKGENFVKPDALVSELNRLGINKLIGTRVLLDGKDVNQYNVNKDGDIIFEKYSSDKKILSINEDTNQLELSDYYHSIILEDTRNKKYYTLAFDSYRGDIKIRDGDKTDYIIEREGKEIIAKKDGNKVEEFSIGNETIKIDGKLLGFKTPYLIDKDTKEITGNKVRVINGNELVVDIPPMPREGYYDISVENPDTKKDSKTGNNGFYYSFQPEYNLDIESIEPDKGSVDGGYFITIKRDTSKDINVQRKFIDNGLDKKTSVFIGGIKLDPKDVEISLDGNEILARVPKYPGNLDSETEMDRKTVPVVVVNPDGGSGRKEDGFTYIIPISHPKIDRLIENEGSASGDRTVYIEGSEFRYYEPYKDLNNNAKYDKDEPFTDINKDDKWTDLRGKKVENLSEDDKKILPKVYFGGKLAEIVSYSPGRIEVKTPKNLAGNAEVYLVNNDQGISNKINYTYRSSKPSIRSITPNVGRRQGGEKIEILGSEFATSRVKLYKSNKMPSPNTNLQLVQFGNNDNKNTSNKTVIGTDEKNTGNFTNEETNEIDIGSLRVKYDNGKLKMKIEEGRGQDKALYEESFDYDLSEVFLPVNLLKDKDGKNYKGNELVRIRQERLPGASNTSRLRIDRGFSPSASLQNEGHINLISPSRDTIGNVPVSVINPDDGRASSNFEYKNPDSNPKIDEILRDGNPGYKVEDGRIILDVSYEGGNLIEIKGSDFRKPVKIKIGELQAISQESIEYDPDESISEKMSFIMPKVSEDYIGKYLRVIVENEDGGVATSEPTYIHFIDSESKDLEIKSISPSFGPTSGGTEITINGKDFRKTMDGRSNKLKVYFGKETNQIQVPEADIISVSFDKIVLKTPPHKAGYTDVKVENPDGNIRIFENGFNYISNPKISSVVHPENQDFIMDTISIEGGDKIRILGSDFMEGARVIFNPKLVEVKDEDQARGDIVNIGDKKYILESGLPASEVEIIDGQNILVTTPGGKLGDKGLIVINPDKAGSNIYELLYGIPEMAAPFNVRAEVVFDQFIRVNWSGVSEASEYEIHMSVDGGSFEFIDTTELTSYAVQKLKPNTEYRFLIKAMGKYGSSKPIDESKSNKLKTGNKIGPVDEQGKLSEKTEIREIGTRADIRIGSKDFTKNGIKIDLTKGDLAGVKDITIRMPAKVVSESLGSIEVLGKDYAMKFEPKVFKTSTIEANKLKANAGVVFSVNSHEDSIDIKPGQTIVGGKYKLKAVTYVDKSLSDMDHIDGNLNLVLDKDPLIIKNRRIKTLETVRYDNSSKSWVNAQRGNRLGLYTVIGSRR